MKEIINILKLKLNKANISTEERSELMLSINSLEKEIHKNDFKLQSLLHKNKLTKNILNNIIEEIEEKNIEIQNYAETLKKTNKTKDRFFSIIAHDLRSPFNSLIGFSDLLKLALKEKDYKEVEELNNLVIQVATQTYKLLLNILNWARSQTNEIKFTPVKIEINKLIKNNIDLFKAQAEKKGIILKFIPSKNIFVYADYDMTNIIIRNLISNAVKYTEKGNITISIDKQNSECLIKIKDTGTGIPKETINHIFNINNNISVTGTSGEKGTGLGLILCKEFADKNNGTISVESEIKKGSTFKLSLPIFKK